MANATLIGIDVGTHRLFVHAQDEHGKGSGRHWQPRHWTFIHREPEACQPGRSLRVRCDGFRLCAAHNLGLRYSGPFA